MSAENQVTHDERVMAALAHGSILLGIFTNGIGGIGAALIIWLAQKEKSAYVAFQALQALIYQVVITVVALVFWCCWGGMWMMMIMPPLIVNPEAYNNAPPAGIWVGLVMLVFPMGFMALSTIYGLVGAIRSFGGHDFKYAGVGNWLERKSPAGSTAQNESLDERTEEQE